ncbi:colicin D domain-containing protein [endosymbiont of Acanthamoeba sp. UWC8]|uniref:colicin D domain-containing protein n=1 Tax=endosymbiont of Acanthamoeba sp. UWC8 TaxID=86106 RepID=UPI00094B76B8|nr:colicin D domain-containing protein [endosymbiont of Acanthamoeba sp. UWC8]
MVEHIKQDDIIVIAGTHRGTERVIHYCNEKTGVNVMKDLEGNFVSGWKLGEAQIKSLKNTGNVQ